MGRDRVSRNQLPEGACSDSQQLSTPLPGSWAQRPHQHKVERCKDERCHWARPLSLQLHRSPPPHLPSHHLLRRRQGRGGLQGSLLGQGRWKGPAASALLELGQTAATHPPAPPLARPAHGKYQGWRSWLTTARAALEARSQ